MAMAWSPDEQNRFTVVPATDEASPAGRAATRAMLWPWAPWGWPQPRMTSSTSLGSRRGALPSTSLIQCAARSSGRVRLNDPRKDFASGVRELATTTASLMDGSSLGQGRWGLGLACPGGYAIGDTGRPGVAVICSVLTRWEGAPPRLRPMDRILADSF